QGEGVCKILEGEVEHYGKCRFAIIPDGLIIADGDEEEDEEEEEESEDISMFEEILNSLKTLFNNKGD
ncbi:MAG: hypothetical protein RL463_1203, partial [Bacteroidota bacterium]